MAELQQHDMAYDTSKASADFPASGGSGSGRKLFRDRFLDSIRSGKWKLHFRRNADAPAAFEPLAEIEMSPSD